MPGFSAFSAMAADSPPTGLGLSNYRIYSVHMDTTVKAPATGPLCTDVRVWHALPTNRPWSQMPSPYGTLDQRAQPAAIIEPEEGNRATHFLWDAKKGQSPNIEMHYISDFRVLSPDRRFDQSSCRLTLDDIAAYNTAHRITLAAPRGEIAEVVRKATENHSACETIVEMSKWIKENFTYDASVTFDGNNLQTILDRRCGHCYHFATLITKLCNGVGIQCRMVKGLNLFSPGGNSDHDQARNDFTNGHVWIEVFLPSVGWIEIEPDGGDKCFSIPASYIQNNTSFQNYAVWVTEEGAKPRLTKWILSGSKYVNDYGLDHKITFREVRR